MSRRPLLLVALAVGALVVAGIVVLIVTHREPDRDLVKIELRAKPIAKMKMNGKRVGTTPLTLDMKPSKLPVELEATFEIHLINPATRDKKTVIKKLTKTVTPDAPQSIEFDVNDATVVDQH